MTIHWSQHPDAYVRGLHDALTVLADQFWDSRSCIEGWTLYEANRERNHAQLCRRLAECIVWRLEAYDTERERARAARKRLWVPHPQTTVPTWRE